MPGDPERGTDLARPGEEDGDTRALLKEDGPLGVEEENGGMGTDGGCMCKNGAAARLPVTWTGLLATLAVLYLLKWWSELAAPGAVKSDAPTKAPTSSFAVSAENQMDDELHYWPPETPSWCKQCSNSSELSLPARMWRKPTSSPTCQVLKRSSVDSDKCDDGFHRFTSFPLLVSCTGRSGSTYVAKFLNKVGFTIAHDGKDGPVGSGAVSWPILFNSKSFQSGVDKNGRPNIRKCRDANKKPSVRFKQSVHLVRHPVQSIRSRWSVGDWIMNFVEDNFFSRTICNAHLWKNWPSELGQDRTPRDNTGPDLLSLVATIRHWVLWNSYASTISSWGFRLEDFVDKNRTFQIVNDLCSRAGKKKKDCPKKKLVDHVNNNPIETYSSHSLKALSWKFSWKALFAADPEYTTMAQLMALRYGYKVKVAELVPPLFDHFCQVSLEGQVFCNVDEWSNFFEPECQFNSNNLWECVIPKQIHFALEDYPTAHFPWDTPKGMWKKHRKTIKKQFGIVKG